MSNNIHFVGLSAYTRPKIIEDKKKDFVQYGEDNLHFTFLIDRYVGSTTNQAIINGKAKMIYGKGLGATDANKNIEDWAKLQMMLKGEDLKRIVTDRVLLGMACAMVTQDKGKTIITHFPMDTLRAGKANAEGDIDTWYYHPNWSERRKGARGTDDLKKYSAYSPDNKDKSQVLIIKPYVPGFFYYPPVDYEGALPYALLEEEIADYLINDCQSGFAPTRIINFNNGTPTPEEQRKTVEQAKQSLLGATGMKTVFAFNDDETRRTTVDAIPLNDAPAHYQYLADECEAKLLKGHKAPAELLGFKGDAAGFANNAEELKNKMIAFDNYELKPYQLEILEALEKVFSNLGITFNLYFKSIEPLEFTEHTAVEENPEEESTLELSVDNSLPDLEDFINKGEDYASPDWEVIDEREVDYEQEDELDAQVREWITESQPKEKLSLLQKITKLVGSPSVPEATPRVKSEDDGFANDNYYRVRYRYVESPASRVARGGTAARTGKPSETRPFCKLMINANKVYRKEDIRNLNGNSVNPGQGGKGFNYDAKDGIWLFKGGPFCGHRWLRVTYKTKTFQPATEKDEISNAQAEREGYRVRNDPRVSQPPRFMPKNGYR